MLYAVIALGVIVLICFIVIGFIYSFAEEQEGIADALQHDNARLRAEISLCQGITPGELHQAELAFDTELAAHRATKHELATLKDRHQALTMAFNALGNTTVSETHE